jgi:hypothetical protein
MDEMSAFFTAWIGAHGKQGACAEVVAWLASGELDPTEFGAIVSRHGVGRERWFRDDMLDLVIEYARYRLGTRLLTLDDITDIQLLKRGLHVHEGEFFDHRPAEVSAFIQLMLDAILADERVDHFEELHLVSVQAAFDLSYDQFLSLGRPALERTIANLDFKRALAERDCNLATADTLTRARAGLEPLCWLTSRQRRTLGALY